MVTLDQGQRPQVMCTKGNAPRSNRQKSIVEMTFGPKLTDLHSSPKERQLQKSCVSFGEECRVPDFHARDPGSIPRQTTTSIDMESIKMEPKMATYPDRGEVGTWSTLHLASNTLLFAYITLPFGMFQAHFLAIWTLEHHFPKLEGGRNMVPSITLPGDLGTWTPLPKVGRRKKCGPFYYTYELEVHPKWVTSSTLLKRFGSGKLV